MARIKVKIRGEGGKAIIERVVESGVSSRTEEVMLEEPFNELARVVEVRPTGHTHTHTGVHVHTGG